MINKEEKFWNAVCDTEIDWQAVSDLLRSLWTRDMSLAVYNALSDACRQEMVLQDDRLLKLSRAYKGNRQNYAAAFLSEVLKAFDAMKEIGRHALLRTDLPVPEEIRALVELSAGAASEWQKILRYMKEVEGNRMKIEARAHRIAAYRERADKESVAVLRELYTGEDAVSLVYWKDAVTALTRFLSAVDRQTELLQKLIEAE